MIREDIEIDEGKPMITIYCGACFTVYSCYKHKKEIPKRFICPFCHVGQQPSNVISVKKTVGNNKTGHKLPASGGRR
jgi:hypothetical protein